MISAIEIQDITRVNAAPPAAYPEIHRLNFPNLTGRPPEAARARYTPEIRNHLRVCRKSSPDKSKTQESGA